MDFTRRFLRPRGGRRGTAVVELAIAAPLLILMALAVVDICNLIFAKQSLAIAAYEGVRVAVVPGANNYDVRTQVQEVCAARGIGEPTVVIDPQDFTNAKLGDMITVTVTAPSGGTYGRLGMISRTQQARVTMMKEL